MPSYIYIIDNETFDSEYEAHIYCYKNNLDVDLIKIVKVN